MLKLKLQYFGHLMRKTDSLVSFQDPDAGKDWRQEEKGKTEDETVEWHHWLNGHEFEQAPGVDDGQEAWSCAESVMTERLNWTELNYYLLSIIVSWMVNKNIIEFDITQNSIY